MLVVRVVVRVARLIDGALRELQQVEGVRSVQTIVLLDEVDRRDQPIWPED